MSTQNEAANKFRPERPIFLNEENTGFKTKIEVEQAIEKLRKEGWLCAYGEKSRPFHMSFNDEKQFQEFKKVASKLNITLKSPVFKEEDLDLDEPIVAPEPHKSFESPDGKIHIDTK